MEHDFECISLGQHHPHIPLLKIAVRLLHLYPGWQQYWDGSIQPWPALLVGNAQLLPDLFDNWYARP